MASADCSTSAGGVYSVEVTSFTNDVLIIDDDDVTAATHRKPQRTYAEFACQL